MTGEMVEPVANENERLVVFSDAVIAITITLLVLDIRLPGDVADLSDGELWAAILSIWPRFLAYGLSFLVIATYWFSHRRKFETIFRRSAGLDWLNMLYLLTIGLLPFVTGVIAESGGSAATAIYAAVVASTSVVGLTISFYAVRAGLSHDAPALRSAGIVSLFTALIFLLSVPLAFIDPLLAKLFWVLIWPAGAIGRKLGRGSKGVKP